VELRNRIDGFRADFVGVLEVIQEASHAILTPEKVDNQAQCSLVSWAEQECQAEEPKGRQWSSA
jgi:hypothetical protein